MKNKFLKTFFFLSLSLSPFHVTPCLAAPFGTVKPVFAIENKADPFKHPSDVAVSNKGSIYILDGVNNRVLVFNYSGKFLFSFGNGGAGNGEMNAPLGLSLGRDGRVYIADSGNGRVQIFSAEGEYLYNIPLPTDVPKPPDPTDTAVDDKNGLLYIVDNDNHALYTYSLKKKIFIRSIGEMGMGGIKGDMRWPFTLDIDKEGNVYIVDVVNTRIRVLNREGIFVNDIGKWGVDRGQLFRPKGVAIDRDGLVYISDSFTGVIQVFDKEGTFIAVITDKNGSTKKFTTPIRIFIDKKKRLYVVEMFAHRVSVYKIK